MANDEGDTEQQTLYWIIRNPIV